MAICRLSDYQCDLYIYESQFGIECHVAALRREGSPMRPWQPIGGGDEAWASYWRDYADYTAALEAIPLTPINLPYDGEFRTFTDWSDLLDYVLILKAAGYQVPDWVIDEIREEDATSGEE